MKRKRAFVALAIVVASVAWFGVGRKSERVPEGREPSPSLAHKQAATEHGSGFFSSPTNRSRGKERQSIQTAEQDFPGGILLSVRDHYETAQTNTFKTKAGTTTFITKKLVNTNAMLSRMRAADELHDEIERRLVALKLEAAALKLGQTKAEVIKLFSEPPTNDKSNNVLNAIVYSPHPDRLTQGDLDSRFEKLFVVFNSNNIVAKFGFTRNLASFWWLVDKAPTE